VKTPVRAPELDRVNVLEQDFDACGPALCRGLQSLAFRQSRKARIATAARSAGEEADSTEATRRIRTSTPTRHHLRITPTMR
jgi:hypothetical protein